MYDINHDVIFATSCVSYKIKNKNSTLNIDPIKGYNWTLGGKKYIYLGRDRNEVSR